MKLTRKSYKRRIVTFGVMLVLAISLISTGFAAWIISQGTTNEQGGNVEVGIVKDKALKIENLTFTADCYYTETPGVAASHTEAELKANPLRFAFDPVYGDAEGRVKFDQAAFDAAEKGKGTGFEALSIKVSGKVSPAAMLDTIQFDLEVPATVKKAVEAGYIVLPECGFYTGLAKNTKTLSAEIDRTHEVAEDYVTFEYTIAFAWGTTFDSKNPCQFFDSETLESTEPNPAFKYSLDEIHDIFDDFRAKMYGVAKESEVTYDETRTYDTYNQETLNNTPAPKFKLTLNVNAK